MRKLIAGTVMVVVLGGALVSMDICDLFEPGSYWSCWFRCVCCDCAGGGGSGAGQP